MTEPPDRDNVPPTSRLWAWATIALAFLWAVARSGVSVTPALGDLFGASTVWPQRLDGDFLAFYTDSPLGILLSRALMLSSEAQFLRLATGATLVAIVSYACVAAWWSPTGARARAVRWALLAPLPAVLLAWLGSYDPFTVAAWLVCLAAWRSGRVWVLALSGVLLGFQHFEHGLLGIVSLTFTWYATRRHLPEPLQRLSPLWLVAGAVAGKLMLTGVLVSSGSAVSGRTQWLAPFLRDWTVTAINTGPTLLWSLFAGSWAIVVAVWVLAAHRRERLFLVLALVVGLLGLALSGDRPRVFVLIMAPSLLLAIVALLRAPAIPRSTIRIIEAIVWLGVPLSLWGSAVVGTGALDQLIMTWQQLTP